MSLKLKIALLFSALMVLVTGGLAGLLVWSESRALSAHMARQRSDLAGGLADVCKSALYSQEDLLLTSYLTRLKSVPGVVHASCVDEGGIVRGHTDLTLLQTAYHAPAEEGLLEISAPVTAGGKTLGMARVFFSQKSLQEQFRAGLAAARRRIFSAALPLMLLGALGSFLLTAWVVRPVRSLVAGARSIGSGKLDHVIPVKTRDEVVSLSLLKGVFMKHSKARE